MYIYEIYFLCMHLIVPTYIYLYPNCIYKYSILLIIQIYSQDFKVTMQNIHISMFYIYTSNLKQVKYVI